MTRTLRTDPIHKFQLPATLPLMRLKSTIVYPLGTIAVQLGDPESLALLREYDEPGLMVALVVASASSDEPIDNSRFVGRVAVAARVHERINLPGGSVQITLQGLRRIVIDEIEQAYPVPVAVIRAVNERATDPAEASNLVARVVASAETLAALVNRVPAEVPAILKLNASDPARFADLVAVNLSFRIADKDEVLQRLDVGDRLRFVLSRLERETARAGMANVAQASSEPRVVTGHVHLVRHRSGGSVYTIGISEAVAGRSTEDAYVTPQGAHIVHSIATDDPIGIEAYWRNRFRDKALADATGMFRLEPDDVAAFSRRRYQ